MAVFLRHHPDYVGDALCARSTLHSMRALLGVGFTKEDHRAIAKEAKMQKLLKSKPHRATGRQVFLADLYAAFRRMLPPGQQMTATQRLEVMEDLDRQWQRLTQEQQAVYRSSAAIQAKQKLEEVNAELQALRSTAPLEEQRREAERALEGTAILRHCRLSREELT
eukprot:2657429-Lingulodinium_polyedra.AAC.1